MGTAPTFMGAAAKKTSSIALGSEHRQVLVQLPGSHLDAVLLPLGALQVDVAGEDMLPEGLQDKLRLGELLDRLTQGFRQLLDAEAGPLVGGQIVEIGLHRLGQLIALLDSLQAGM